MSLNHTILFSSLLFTLASCGEGGSESAGRQSSSAGGPSSTAGGQYNSEGGQSSAAGGGGPARSTIAIQQISPQETVVGAAVELQIVATHSNNRILTYQVENLPQGLSIDETTGLISGRPELEGVSSVVVRVSDGGSSSESITFQWQVLQNEADEPDDSVDGDYRLVAGQEIPFFEDFEQNFTETYASSVNSNLWEILYDAEGSPILQGRNGAGNWAQNQSGFVSNNKFEDYQLEFEFRYNQGQGKRNSGVWILGGDEMTAVDNAYPESLEVQLRQDTSGTGTGSWWTGDILRKEDINADPDGGTQGDDNGPNDGDRFHRHAARSHLFDYDDWTQMIVKVIDASDYVDDQGESKGVIVEVHAVTTSGKLELINKAQRVARVGPSRIAFQAESSDIQFRNIVVKSLTILDAADETWVPPSE